jgi:hypothetical protein
MPTTAPGRRGDATRSGLAQVDAAEDLVAVVAAAVAVNVARSVVHVLDHGRGADRRITINRVGRRRVAREDLLTPSTRRLFDGVAMPVPHRSTEPARPR